MEKAAAKNTLHSIVNALFFRKIKCVLVVETDRTGGPAGVEFMLCFIHYAQNSWHFKENFKDIN